MSPWILKDEQEYRKQSKKRKFSPEIQIMCFFMFLIFSIIGEKIGWGPELYGFSEPATWQEIFRFLPKLILLCCAASGILYIIQIFLPKKWSGEDPVVICKRCGKVKTADMQKVCICGGRFDEIEKYKWVSDPDNDDNQEQDRKPL